MKNKIIITTCLILLSPISYAQDVTTTTQQTDISTTPAFAPAPTTTIAPTSTTTSSSTSYNYDRLAPPSYCPSADSYNIPNGYRLAGISPSCKAVIIPMSTRFIAKDPDEVD